MELTVSKDSLGSLLREEVKLPAMFKKSFLSTGALFVLKGDAKGKLKSIRRLTKETNPMFDSLTAKVLAKSKKYWDEISLEKKLKGGKTYWFIVSFRTVYNKKKDKVYFKLLTNNVSLVYDSLSTFPALFLDTVNNTYSKNRIKVKLNSLQQVDRSYGTVGLGLSFDSTGAIVSKSIIQSVSKRLDKVALSSLDHLKGYFIPPHSNGKKTSAYSEMFVQLDEAGYAQIDWSNAKQNFEIKHYQRANKLFKRTASFFFNDIEAQFNAGVSCIYIKDTAAACKYFYKAYELSKIKPCPYNTPLAKIISTINTFCIK